MQCAYTLHMIIGSVMKYPNETAKHTASGLKLIIGVVIFIWISFAHSVYSVECTNVIQQDVIIVQI